MDKLQDKSYGFMFTALMITICFCFLQMKSCAESDKAKSSYWAGVSAGRNRIEQGRQSENIR